MRLTRAESKQQTRAAVLAAAREVFARDGFHGATLERVAEQAGFTKGAVYSAFDSKADLFLAVYEARIAERAAWLEGKELRAGLDEWRQVLRDQREWSAALTEFWVHASRDEQLRERFGAAHRAWRRTMAGEIERAAAAEGRTLPADGERMATVMLAFGNGLALEGLLGDDQSELLELVMERLVA